VADPTLILRPGREKSVLRRHPWIFSGAVARVEGEAEPGDTVAVKSASGDFLARAAYNPHSQIVGRIWSWNQATRIDVEFFRERIARSIAARAGLAETTNAMRLVYAESDGVPGLIVDRYADFVVCQFLTAGAEKWKQEIADVLAGLPGVAGVYERSDVDVRAKEGLREQVGELRGASPPELVEIWESTPDGKGVWRYAVDVRRGHKTGFYLDQRESRKIIAGLARRQKILNTFSYTGAFTINTQWRNTTIAISLDSSQPALDLAKHNLSLNNLPPGELINADAFTQLREYRDQGETFDLIVIDPPKFAHSESQIKKASRAYKDINWLALRLLNPGGHLITFSCSGLVSEELFQKILFGAALDAKRDVQIVQRLGQASDHPILLSFPEAAYLKGFVCRVE
jgi:23S rRNA (cytosine1962-C5)-methyltransferase